MEGSYNMTYNLTLLKGYSGITGLINFVNYTTNDLFSAIVVISLYIILLMVLKRFDFIQSLIASSWVMFLISLLLTYAGLLNMIFPLFFLSVAAFAALYLYTAGY